MGRLFKYELIAIIDAIKRVKVLASLCRNSVSLDLTAQGLSSFLRETVPGSSLV
jgi:hypothetical protein